MEILMEHVGKGFMYMLLISMPCVLIAAGVGLVVGILQAITQVQEQTIAAAPKILSVFLVIMIFGGFFMKTLTTYFLESANLAFNVITHEDDFVLPANGSLHSTLGFMSGKNDMKMDQPSVQSIMKNHNKPPYVEKQEKNSLQSSRSGSSSGPNFIESKKIMGR
jgi:flagellar biosynthetic protein FliQ